MSKLSRCLLVALLGVCAAGCSMYPTVELPKGPAAVAVVPDLKADTQVRILLADRRTIERRVVAVDAEWIEVRPRYGHDRDHERIALRDIVVIERYDPFRGVFGTFAIVFATLALAMSL